MPILKSKNTHFLEEVKPARIKIEERQPLEILDFEGICDLDFGEAHLAPAIADPHIHCRESYIPSKQEWEEYWELGLIKTTYEKTLQKIALEKQNYSLKNAILAALKGGLWYIGAMSNTAFPAISEKIWKKTTKYYQDESLDGICQPIFIHLWSFAHPKVEKILGQCAKDFGSTFGSEGFTKKDRQLLYQKHKNSDIRFHNDKARVESMKEFLKIKKAPLGALLHDYYYSSDLVLQEQQEVYELAKQNQLASLIPLHIPTGSALEQALKFQKENILNIELEIGLDYLIHNLEQKAKEPTRWHNYRRPAHPSYEEQVFLIELLKKNTNNHKIWIASDHAPHSKEEKKWRNNLPGFPGTRCVEFFGAILQKLVDKWGFSYLEIDKIASYNPSMHLQKYKEQPFDYPIGSIKTGNMANLRVFEPTLFTKVSENTMGNWLKDKEYHSSFCQKEDLKGQNLMTIVNGICFDTRTSPKRIIFE